MSARIARRRPNAVAGARRPGPRVEDLGSYKAGALVDPDAAMATTIPIAGEPKESKVRPTVAIGWGALVLLLAMLARLAGARTEDRRVGAAGCGRLYALLGKPVNLRGLDIQEVQLRLEQCRWHPGIAGQGRDRQSHASEVECPPVVDRLEDKAGKEIAAVTAKVLPGRPPAPATPSWSQIPSPPQTVKSLKVRFAKAS